MMNMRAMCRAREKTALEGGELNCLLAAPAVLSRSCAAHALHGCDPPVVKTHLTLARAET